MPRGVLGYVMFYCYRKPSRHCYNVIETKKINICLQDAILSLRYIAVRKMFPDIQLNRSIEKQ